MTKIEKRILETIIEYIQKHGYSPTTREIGEAVERTPSTVCIHLKRLREEGIIETDKEMSPRAIRVPGYTFVRTKDCAPPERSGC